MVILGAWGPDPLALHAANISLHLAASALVWRLAASVPGTSPVAALLALAFFALAPIHEEPVAWISAGSHILVTVLILASVLLFRRFQTTGNLGSYLASIGAAIAAFTTLEIAVALPALLVLRDIVDARGPSRRWLLRQAMLHAPFWVLLIAYLGFRVLSFGAVTPDGDTPSALESLRNVARSVRAVSLSLALVADAPGVLVVAIASALLFLLVSPFLFLRRDGSVDAARRGVFLGFGWTALSMVPLMGGYTDQRHVYLASVGLALATGLAGGRLLVARPLLAVGAIVFLLTAHSFFLASGVAKFARDGEHSRQLVDEVGAASARASQDPGALVVVIAKLPAPRWWFWEYSLPFAAGPPFIEGVATRQLIPSYPSYCCGRREWDAAYGAALGRAASNENARIFVVEWDAWQTAFVTRLLDAAEFRAAGYAEPGGPVVPGS